MNTELLYAIITTNLALVLYTLGVWGEKKSGILKKWHVILFWLGLIFDSTGTLLMSNISKTVTKTIPEIELVIHETAGIFAIILMIFNALYATWILKRNNEHMKKIFHKFSILIWFIWLIPYCIGMIMGMHH